MEIHQITFNTFQENTFILWDNTTDCIIIDPGCYERNEELELVDFINKNNLNPVKLINTHCHIDHILGNKFVSEKWDLELYMNKIDLPLLEGSGDIARMYGFENYKGSPYPKHYLEEGDILEFGESKLEILFTPGHAPGHICLFNKEEGFIVSGDVLFNGSIGRTDLPGGDHATLLESIRQQLFTLPDDFVVYCGHGPETQIGFEKQNNPFLNS